MSFWDFIKNLFAPKGNKQTPVVPDPPAAPADRGGHDDDIYISTMINSLSFSSSMKKLYLIDDERCITFDLEKGGGVIVGLLGDQITVATAREPLKPVSIKTSKDKLVDSKDDDVAGANPLPLGREFSVNAGKRHQCLTYNPVTQKLSVIGADIIDIGIGVDPDKESECAIRTIDLERFTVQISRKGKGITFRLKPVAIRT